MAEVTTMRPMLVALLMTACGAATLAGAQSPRNTSGISWGKAGVSLEDYRSDATACALEAVNLDIVGTEPAQRLVAASRALRTVEDSMSLRLSQPAGTFGADYARVRDTYQPERQFEAIEALQQQALDSCLIQRGYRQFRLSDEQKQRLRQFERGSDERRAYLHSLGSDAEVLRQQAI